MEGEEGKGNGKEGNDGPRERRGKEGM